MIGESLHLISEVLKSAEGEGWNPAVKDLDAEQLPVDAVSVKTTLPLETSLLLGIYCPFKMVAVEGIVPERGIKVPLLTEFQM
jgi:hypothetical protein